MDQKLKSISLAGYKSIREATVELRDLNVLVGANGAGKSNLISAFGMLREMIEGRLGSYVARRGGASSLLYFGRKATDHISFQLSFDLSEYLAVLSPTDMGGLFFEREECHDDHETNALVLGTGHAESKLGALRERLPEGGMPREIVRSITHDLRGWQVFHFHDVSDAAPVKQLHAIADHQYLRADAKNLAAFLHRLRNSDQESYRASYQRIVAALRQVAPYFDDFVLEPDGVRSDLIQLAWREKGSDDHFFAASLSDGTLRFICLATLLLQPAELLPSLIIIDEPELGLHPFAIHQLAAMLKSVSSRAQVLVSTQSVTLMNQLQADDLIVVDRKTEHGRGYSEFRRVSGDEISEWTSEYALGEIWEKNIIGGRPR